MYEYTLPEILEMKQYVDVREAQTKAIDIDDKIEQAREASFSEANK